MVHRLFSIYRGEGRKALLFGALAFLTALSIVCGVTLSDGLFLEEIGGSGLPLVFLFTAIGMLSGSTLYLWALHRFSIGQIALTLCSSMLLFYGAIALIGLGSEPWLWFLLKAGCYCFLTVMWTALWSFIDQYYDLQDAKRLYGLFTACLVTGCAAGSGLVYILVTRLPIEGMLLVAGASVSLVALWISVIMRTQKIVEDDTVGEAAPRADERSILSILRQIATSRFTLLLLLSSFFVEILTAVTEFKYMDRLSTLFVSDHELTLFLAKCRTCIYLCNVFFGLFFYSRSVKRFGTNTLLMLPSLYFTLLFAIWPFNGGVLPAVLGLIAIEGVLYAVDDPNFNLLINAVPAKLKARVRVLIESFFEPLGLLLSALLLIAIQCDALLLGVCASLLSVVICIGLYRAYSPALFSILSQNAIHFERRPKEWLKSDESTQQSCLKALGSSDLAQVDLACHALLEIASLEHIPYLLSALERLDKRARSRLLELLSKSEFCNEPLVIAHLKRWSDQPQLADDAALYLAKQGHLSLERIDLFESENPEEIALDLSLLPHILIDDRMEKLRPYLRHPSLIIERAAVAALAEIASTLEAPICIEKLKTSGDPKVRSSALKALARVDDLSIAEPLIDASAHLRPAERRQAESILCGLGPRVVPTLLASMQNRSLHDRCRLLAGRAMGRAGLPQLQLHINDLLHDEIERAYFYLFHWATLKNRSNLRLLAGALETGFHLVVDFIVQMLGSCVSMERASLLSHSLRSSNEKIHSQAVEMLADSCDRELFRQIEPLIDDRPIDNKIAAYLEGGRRPYSLTELLERLQESSSPIDSIIAATIGHQTPEAPRPVPQATPLALELARA